MFVYIMTLCMNCAGHSLVTPPYRSTVHRDHDLQLARYLDIPTMYGVALRIQGQAWVRPWSLCGGCRRKLGGSNNSPGYWPPAPISDISSSRALGNKINKNKSKRDWPALQGEAEEKDAPLPPSPPTTCTLKQPGPACPLCCSHESCKRASKYSVLLRW